MDPVRTGAVAGATKSGTSEMNQGKDEKPFSGPGKRHMARAAASTFGSLGQVLMLGPRVWKGRWNRLVRSVQHQEIIGRAQQEAALSFNYVFMVAMAAGIATIGLLLNSPAVIIGAMLISPLMGPIVGTGFAIAGFDVELGKRGALALLVGALAAVGFAAAIVWISPVRELTSEILARTRPNLLDLAVAILSGAAGGYGMIRGRGGAIVGVAIATALMPPLAVVGYGLATWQWTVARGALLLFVTNMVAIALAVAAIAEWYGFGRGGLRKRFAAQAVVSLLVLAPLAVPLYLSLRSIAWESRVQTTVHDILEAGAEHMKNGQLAQMRIRFNGGEPPFVEAIIVSDQTRPGFDVQLRKEIQASLGVPVALHLTQLQADDPEALAVARNRIAGKLDVARLGVDMVAALRSELPFPLAAVEVNPERKTVVIVPRIQAGVGLAAWHDIEAALMRRYPDWHLTVVPPVTDLPPVEFASGAYTLDAAAAARLREIAWALARWSVKEVRLTGHASSTAGGSKVLARRRVAAVGRWFTGSGIKVQELAIYPAPRQTAREREIGEAAFRSVEIVMVAPAQLPSPAGKH